MDSLTYDAAKKILQEHGFYLVKHPVVVHHLLKDFDDYDVRQFQFYIKPAGEDFIHVALVEHTVEISMSWDPPASHYRRGLQLRYTCAGDDLLYGLRIKFNSGGSHDVNTDMNTILHLINGIENNVPEADKVYQRVRGHERYVRKRFKHGVRQAKTRAFFQMVKDLWKKL